VDLAPAPIRQRKFATHGAAGLHRSADPFRVRRALADEVPILSADQFARRAIAAPGRALVVYRDNVAIAVERVVPVADAVEHGAEAAVYTLQSLDQGGEEDRGYRENQEKKRHGENAVPGGTAGKRLDSMHSAEQHHDGDNQDGPARPLAAKPHRRSEQQRDRKIKQRRK